MKYYSYYRASNKDSNDNNFCFVAPTDETLDLEFIALKLPRPFAVWQQIRCYFKQQTLFFFSPSDIIAPITEHQSTHFIFYHDAECSFPQNNNKCAWGDAVAPIADLSFRECLGKTKMSQMFQLQLIIPQLSFKIQMSNMQYQSKVWTHLLIQGWFFIWTIFNIVELYWRPLLWNNTWNYVVTKKGLNKSKYILDSSK